MFKLFEKWCYGGKNREFFEKHNKQIVEYNSKIISNLLLLLSFVIGAYLVLSIFSNKMHYYIPVYLSYTVAFILMFIAFRVFIIKSLKATKIFMWIFIVAVYSFTCIIGIFYQPNFTAVMYLVFLLTLPLLIVAPMHQTYAFLTITQIIFSIMALNVKEPSCAYMDTIHGFTCLVIGFFVSHQVLKSRISNLAINDRLKKMSNIDGLTGIPNRRCLDQYLRNICPVFDNLVFVIMDIDNFKTINDTYGHLKGDEIIKAVAMSLEKCASDEGFFVARYGGDEFVMVDINHTPDEVKSIIESVVKDIAALNLICDETGKNIMTLSVGYAEEGAGSGYETILKRADKALYRAKDNGKNCIMRA